MDRSDLLEHFVEVLRELDIRFCVVGGQGVNAYVDPLVSLDLDLAIASGELQRLEPRLRGQFVVERFPHSLNVSQPGSELRIQVQTDPRYAAFVDRASNQQVLGVTLPVASIEDVLQGKMWAAMDETRRRSKRQKDLADIARLIEKYPELRARVPPELLAKLL